MVVKWLFLVSREPKEIAYLHTEVVPLTTEHRARFAAAFLVFSQVGITVMQQGACKLKTESTSSVCRHALSKYQIS